MCVPPISDVSVVRSNDGEIWERGIPLQTLVGFFHQSREFLILMRDDRDLSSLSLFGL